jgi:hypothetical protein
MRKKEAAEPMWRIQEQAENHKMCLHVRKQLIANGSKAIKFREEKAGSAKRQKFVS